MKFISFFVWFFFLIFLRFLYFLFFMVELDVSIFDLFLFFKKGDIIMDV